MEDARSLWQLAPGHRAWVGELSAQGELRRRLRDLGFVPGPRWSAWDEAPWGTQPPTGCGARWWPCAAGTPSG